jgi:predicted Fe-Mo cluster-binding NifX family protein
MISGMPTSSTPLPSALGRPAIRAFEAAGFRTLGDLEGTSEQVLLDLHGVGPRAIKILREQGVSLRS